MQLLVSDSFIFSIKKTPRLTPSTTHIHSPPPSSSLCTCLPADAPLSVHRKHHRYQWQQVRHCCYSDWTMLRSDFKGPVSKSLHQSSGWKMNIFAATKCVFLVKLTFKSILVIMTLLALNAFMSRYKIHRHISLCLHSLILSSHLLTRQIFFFFIPPFTASSLHCATTSLPPPPSMNPAGSTCLNANSMSRTDVCDNQDSAKLYGLQPELSNS